MRINRYVATALGIGRRKADALITEGQVTINAKPAKLGDTVSDAQDIRVNGRRLEAAVKLTTVMLHKPVGYVCSRDGQGSKTVYDLLPAHLHHLNPVGRLDRDSSGLLLMTNDGKLANQLTHPRYGKEKHYFVRLNRALSDSDLAIIGKNGVHLPDGVSKFELDPLNQTGTEWQITMYEGRNRQIRRTFSALDYTVKVLHRTQFGVHRLGNLRSGKYLEVRSLRFVALRAKRAIVPRPQQ